MDSLRVFIVEDEKEVREGLKYLLNLYSEIKVARTFSCAEDLIADLESGREADIVLMDIGLPGIDGIKATEKIRQIKPEIKVIMLTVFEEPEKIFKAIKAGAAGYVLKNTKPAQLVEQLKTLNRGGAPISPEAAGKLFSEIQKESLHDNTDSSSYHLTEREYEVLKDIAEGYNYRETAERMNISSATVKKHILHIYRKLNVSSRVEFMKKVINENLI
jgi:DNA-binding NarL/FixJ family response regulator